VIEKPQKWGGYGPRWAAASEEKKYLYMYHPVGETCIDYSARITQHYVYNIFNLFITTWFVDLYDHHQVDLQINKKKCISGRCLPFKNIKLDILLNRLLFQMVE
jgi:hypothetical protein